MTSSPFHEHDYYGLFGLSPSATAAEIVDAYRRLALRYHPDVAAEAAGSPEMFKRISEAYAVLSDPQQRRRYDRRRARARRSSPPENVDVTSRDVGQSRTERSSRSDHSDPDPVEIVAVFTVSPEEARAGGVFDLTVTIRTACRRCAGCGRRGDLVCIDCEGEGRILYRRRLQLSLPRGMRDGCLIRPANQGQVGLSDVGNLVLRIRIRPY